MLQLQQTGPEAPSPRGLLRNVETRGACVLWGGRAPPSSFLGVDTPQGVSLWINLYVESHIFLSAKPQRQRGTHFMGGCDALIRVGLGACLLGSKRNQVFLFVWLLTPAGTAAAVAVAAQWELLLGWSNPVVGAPRCLWLFTFSCISLA